MTRDGHLPLLAILIALVVGCTEGPDPLEELEALLEAGAYGDLLLATDALMLDEGPEWVEAHEPHLRRYLVLGSAGLGDCGPAEELLDDPSPGLSDRRVASLASEAASLAVRDSGWDPLQGTWPSKPYYWMGTSLEQPEIVAWNDRVYASECVLEEARRRFPAAADPIAGCLDRVRAERIDEDAIKTGSDANLSWLFSRTQCDFD